MTCLLGITEYNWCLLVLRSLQQNYFVFRRTQKRRFLIYVVIIFLVIIEIRSGDGFFEIYTYAIKYTKNQKLSQQFTGNQITEYFRIFHEFIVRPVAFLRFTGDTTEGYQTKCSYYAETNQNNKNHPG